MQSNNIRNIIYILFFVFLFVNSHSTLNAKENLSKSHFYFHALIADCDSRLSYKINEIKSISFFNGLFNDEKKALKFFNNTVIINDARGRIVIIDKVKDSQKTIISKKIEDINDEIIAECVEYHRNIAEFINKKSIDKLSLNEYESYLRHKAITKKLSNSKTYNIRKDFVPLDPDSNISNLKKNSENYLPIYLLIMFLFLMISFFYHVRNGKKKL